ncbi:MAG: sugar phosphate nucleotidyltransferase [Bdellovibrionota bacterium]
MTGPKKTKILILAGGKGTRLASVDPTRPKPMVEILGKPFLYWLINHYEHLGYARYLLSTGHLAEVIETYPWNSEFPNCEFEFFREKTPLGTGGAVQKIFRDNPSLQETWVINGDTLLPEPLPESPDQNEALYTALAQSEVFDAIPNIHTEDDLVVAEGAGGQYFDGGAIFLRRQAVERYQGGVPCSIHSLLEPAMRLKRVAYALVPGTCYDIGTPKRLKRFEEYLSCFKI